MPVEQLEIDWNKLLFSFRRKRCILMVGPRIRTNALEEGTMDAPPLEQLAVRIAEELTKLGIPYDEAEKTNLPYISQRYLSRKKETGQAQRKRVDLEDLAKGFLNKFRNDPDEDTTYDLLAKLPVKFILSVSPDRMLKTALANQNKKPINYHYNFRLSQNSSRNETDRNIDLSTVSIDQPLLMELFGTVDDPESLVLSSSDRMYLIKHITRGEPEIPAQIKGLLDKDKTYLFFGFNFNNWEFRLLLDSLKLTGETRTMTPTTPNFPITAPVKAFFHDEFNFHFINQDLNEFAKILGEKVAEMGDISQEQIYILHGEKDTDIRDGLTRFLFPLTRKEGLTVWHRGKLEQGDDRKKLIRENFDRSTIIIVLLSGDMMADMELWESEMAWVEERHKAGLVEIMPVLARPCRWQDDPFLKTLEPLPVSDKDLLPAPIDSDAWFNRDQAFEATVFQISRKLL